MNRPEARVRAFVSLGANLGDPVAALRRAIAELGSVPGVEVASCSSFYRTAPVDSPGPDYVNAVAEVRTALPALDLLHAMQAIENANGRVRPAGIRNAPRTLDLDLLLYGSLEGSDAELVLPHPRMHERAFVLVPLVEICPDCEIPGKGRADVLLEGVREQAIEKIPPAQGICNLEVLKP